MFPHGNVTGLGMNLSLLDAGVVLGLACLFLGVCAEPLALLAVVAIAGVVELFKRGGRP